MRRLSPLTATSLAAATALAVALVLAGCGTARPAADHPSAPAVSRAPSVVVSGRVSAAPAGPVPEPGRRAASPVTGAVVTVRSGTRVVATTRTDAAGDYRVTLAPGSYAVAVRMTGLRLPQTRTAVVSAGHALTLNFKLDTSIQ